MVFTCLAHWMVWWAGLYCTILYGTVLYCTVLYLFGPLDGVVGGVGQDAALEGDVLPCVDQGGVVTTLSEQPHLGLVCNIR